MTITIGLLGFGRTGTLVANEIIKDQDCQLKWVLRKHSNTNGEYASHLLGHHHQEGEIFSFDDINLLNFFETHKVDVIIDFSKPSSVYDYPYAIQYGTRIVSAISNYDEEHFQLLEELGKKAPIFYSPNITFGINFLMEVSKLLKKIVPDADIEIIEEHFKAKKDISGTAIRIANELQLDHQKHINSIRVGDVIGKHEVIFGLPHQTIRISHETHNRAAFGQGAIFAAKWIMNQNNGLYTMEQAITNHELSVMK